MQRRVGKSVITLLLCLAPLSALIFVILESNKIDRLALATDIPRSSPSPPALIEAVDPWKFMGIMLDYDFDLYRQTGPDEYEYVQPPEFDYFPPGDLSEERLAALGVTSDEIYPASRETTISLTLLRKPPATPVAPTPTAAPPTPGHPTPTPRPTVTPFPMKLGQFSALTFYLTPATKTVNLDYGASTATVQIMPDVVDAYVAVRTPKGNLVFVNTFSHQRLNFTSYPVPIVKNSPITKMKGTIFTFKMTSQYMPGRYKIYGVLTPPGANVFDPNNWISNLAMIYMSYNVVAQ